MSCAQADPRLFHSCHPAALSGTCPDDQGVFWCFLSWQNRQIHGLLQPHGPLSVFSNIANSKKGWRCLQSSSINFDHPLCSMVSLDLPHVPSARYHKMIPPLDSNFCCYNHLARSLEGQIRWFSTTVAVAAIHPFWLMISSGLYYHSKSVYHSILHISWYIIIYWIVSWYPNILAMIYMVLWQSTRMTERFEHCPRG